LQVFLPPLPPLPPVDPFFGRGDEIDWLTIDVEEPPYRRIKDGITYAELRKMMLEREEAAD